MNQIPTIDLIGTEPSIFLDERRIVIVRPVDGIVESEAERLNYTPRDAETGVCPVCPYGRPGGQVRATVRGKLDHSDLILDKVEIQKVGSSFMWLLSIAPMPEAVSVIIPCAEDLSTVLAVTRPSNSKKWGLPGGKKEKTDATVRAAALRELEEETGLMLISSDLMKIFGDVSPGNWTYYTHTYLAKKVFPYEGAFYNRERCTVASLPWSALTDPEKCPFADYNQGLKRALDTLLNG